jgi:2-alkyl-3-oxoalkanoate reductase
LTDPGAADARNPGAIRYLERTVTAAGGLALRYGGLYGSPEDRQIELVRKRRFAIVGTEEAPGPSSTSTMTVLALERGAPGVDNVVDDEPAPVSEWLPALADAIGAKPPRRVPR